MGDAPRRLGLQQRKAADHDSLEHALPRMGADQGQHGVGHADDRAIQRFFKRLRCLGPGAPFQRKTRQIEPGPAVPPSAAA